jgi:hypothetical protein
MILKFSNPISTELPAARVIVVSNAMAEHFSELDALG